MITISKVSMKKDFQENEVMPLLHEALQLVHASAYLILFKQHQVNGVYMFVLCVDQ